MRASFVTLSLIALSLGPLCQAQDTPAPAAPKPHTYAIVSAVGDTFNFVNEERPTGISRDPVRRRNVAVPDNVLNKLVLRELDQMLERTDPGSTRVAMSMPMPNLQKVGAAQREQASIDAVIARLKTQPHASWDKIIVVTPAYRPSEQDGMAGRLQGFGIFVQSTCQATRSDCEDGNRPLKDGAAAVTADSKAVLSKSFAAPFSYIAVWRLDPATLKVLDRLAVFEHRKVTSEFGDINGLLQGDNTAAMAEQMLQLISLSLHDAFGQPALVGRVEVLPVTEPPATAAAK